MSAEGAAVRDDRIDLIKGIGITFVLLNHSFVRGIRNFHDIQVKEDLVMYGINRAIHFAVPIFLFISALVLTQSFQKRMDVRRYSLSRARKTLIPYLFFTTFYLAFRYFVTNEPLTLPEVVEDYLTGKGYFHLYFTIVLLQVTVAVPILVTLFRDRKLPFWGSMLAAIALQLIAYDFQRRFLGIPSPGSTVLWYLVPLVLGFALGRDEVLQGAVTRDRTAWLLGAIGFGAFYVWSALGEVGDWPTSSDQINLAYVLFTAWLALALWTWTPVWPKGALRKFWTAVGRHSLPLFLIHPLIMYYLGGPRVRALLGQLPMPVLFYYLLVFGLSFAFAWVALRWKPLQLLFGQAERPYGKSLNPS